MSANDSTRVVVGMSGGVDSSVAALLLKEQGFDVHGLFMTNWEEDEQAYCTAAEDYQDARQVCLELNIPLHKVNFSAEYRQQVFQYFLDEYQANRTPNPDVLCNREIKFGVFLGFAKRLGGEMIATGHYARIGKQGESFRLLKGKDRRKDQSYFLHAIKREVLSQVLFPLGELDKSEVRLVARKNGFDNFAKKDSTGICFIGERRFRPFLQNYLPAQPGEIQTPAGEVLGRHEGLMYYTLGQRQGLGIGGQAGGASQPWYVADKRVTDNVLVVVQGHEHPMLYSDALIAGPMHWLKDEPVRPRFRCQVKTRYRQADQACEVRVLSDGQCRVVFDEPQWAITPGQFAVLYQADECLGGGTILASESASILPAAETASA